MGEAVNQKEGEAVKEYRKALLNHLAMSLSEWPTDMPPPPDVLGLWSYHREWRCQAHVNQELITAHDWLEQRVKLINEPSEKAAPPWAICKAQDSSGHWHWFSKVPVAMDKQWDLLSGGRLAKASKGAIPAGHNWKETITPVIKRFQPKHNFAQWLSRTRPFFEMVFDKWDGKGIPPEGTECEYRLGNSSRWHRCVIKAVCKEQGAIIQCYAAAYGEQYVSLYDTRYNVEFRPIKTAEQRAKDEAVAAMIKHAPWSDENADDVEISEAIYQAVREGKVPALRVDDEAMP